MSSLTAPAPVVSSGVDFLTMTCNRQGAIAGLLHWKDERFAELVAEGFEARSVGGHGYAGTRLGPLDVQTGRSDILLRLSGDYARRYWRDVAVHATNVSRLDLETTTRAGADDVSLARSGYASALRSATGRGRRPAYTLIQGSKSGDTLYVGRRISSAWGRLYDKAKESGDPFYARCWRYEVEFKGRPAYEAAQALLQTRSEGEMVSGTVHRWFNARGVSPVFSAGSAAVSAGAPRALADYQRWCAWVRRVVRPRAQKELQQHEWWDLVLAAVGPPPGRAALEHALRSYDETV